MQDNLKDKVILVTGGTGYVGARLVSRLLDAGYKVRATARNVSKLAARPWSDHENLEIVGSDLLDFDSLTEAVKGCSYVYYLVHSMAPGVKNFAENDKKAAHNMVQAARENGVKRIIYLGGLGAKDAPLSKHLQSRNEVANILRESNIPLTELKAAMIIGSGSASFEILRYLVDRLPIMVTPPWIETKSQPIAIRNVLNYLIGCLECPDTAGRSFDIGGDEVISYRELMDLYAEETGLKKRFIIPLPFLSPVISAYWIQLVTPISSAIALPLAPGLKNTVTCTNNEIRDIIPQKLYSSKEAIQKAIKRVADRDVASHWSDAGHTYPPEWADFGDPRWAGGSVFEDKRRIVVEGNPKDVWKTLVQIGGDNGWYYGNWLWRLRGYLDSIIGGVGLRRGRRDATELRPGDALDFWRVLDVKDDERLLLAAEMKLPGEAVLEFKLKQITEGRTRIIQNALFKPRGLFGLIYWFLVSPFHHFVFDGLLNGIAKEGNLKVLKKPQLITRL